MRENRKSGSEGGAIQTNVSFLPLSAHTKKSGVTSSFFGSVPLINLFHNALDRSVVTSNFNHGTLFDS